MSSNRLKETEQKVDDLLKELNQKTLGLDEEGKKFYTEFSEHIQKIYSELTNYRNEIKKDAEVARQNLFKNYLDAREVASNIFTILNSALQKFILLILPFGILVFLGLLWPFIVYFFPSILKIIPIDPQLLSSIVTILGTVILFVVAWTIKKSLDENLAVKAHKFDDLESQLEKIDILQKKPYNLKMEKVSDQTGFEKVKSSFGIAMQYLSRSTPVLKEVYSENKFVSAWENTCDEVKNSLNFFKINVESEITSLKINPPSDARDKEDAELKAKLVLRNLAEKLKIDEKILEILFEYYRGKNTYGLWVEIKADDKKCKILAKILYNSGHIDVNNQDIKEGEIFEILKKTKEFSPIEISKNVNLCHRVHNYFKNYETRLSDEGVLLERNIGITQIVKSIDFNQTFEMNFLTLFSEALESNLKIENKKAYANALMAILLNKDINFKRNVCQGASDDDVVYLLMAYHELMQKKNEENKHFKLGDLLADINAISQMKTKLADDPELKRRFDFFKVELGNGDWYDSGTFLLKRLVEELEKDLSKKIKKADKYAIIHKVIDKNFANVNINTVEKAVDANLFSVYLIMSASEEGKLVDKIDVLSCRKPDFGYKKPVELQSIERQYSLTLTKNNKPKYDFVKYSTATRVGVLDRNTSFSDFKKEFMQDIRKIILKEPGNLKIGLSTLRITPSKYSFGILDDEVADLDNVETKNLHLASLIAALARDHIAESEKAVMATFDKNVDLLEIINQQSILELINSTGTNFSGDSQKLLGSQELKIDLFNELSGIDIKNFKELAIVINKASVQKSELLAIFKKAFSKKYSISSNYLQLNDNLCDRLANELFNALEAVSTLWEN
jgi:hypothetical protein